MAYVKTRVKYDKNWEEYKVFLIVDGRTLKDATYHTDDKDDAYDTAAQMAKNYRENEVAVNAPA